MSQFLIDGQGPGPSGGLVKDTTTRDFKTDVIDASMEQPVLVDFWAPWCGPCRQLTPVLEKVVNEAGGKVRLVKMNIDDYPEIAGQLGVQSIPAVFAFSGGRPVDGFMGALPESQIKEFIGRLSSGEEPDFTEHLDAAEKALGERNFQAAASAFASVLQADEGNTLAIGGLVRTMVSAGETERAAQILSQLPEEMAADPEIERARQALELAKEGEKAQGEIAALEQRITANPDDYEARLSLAKALNAVGEKERAIEMLLHVQKRAPDWNEGAAKAQLLAFFEAWGPKDPMTALGRRRLSSILFS